MSAFNSINIIFILLLLHFHMLNANLLEEKVKQKRTCKVKAARRFPTNCYEAVTANDGKAGIYKIVAKFYSPEPFHVVCHFDPSGNVWTVFQRRINGAESFDRSFEEYENGFGALNDEFWLGLKKLHAITTESVNELYIEMETITGTKYFAHYDAFAVGDSQEQYYIKFLGAFTGTSGESFRYHTGQLFSTRDRDNDQWFNGSCGLRGGSGWWFRKCFLSNLNGKYGENGECGYYPVNWDTLTPDYECLKSASMMVRSSNTPLIELKFPEDATTPSPFDDYSIWGDL